jgi:hypothetical protein
VFNTQTRNFEHAMDWTINTLKAAKHVRVIEGAQPIEDLRNAMATINRVNDLEVLAQRVLASEPGAPSLMAGARTAAARIPVLGPAFASEASRTFVTAKGAISLQISAVLNQGRPTEPDRQAVEALTPSEFEPFGTARMKLEVLRRMFGDVVDLIATGRTARSDFLAVAEKYAEEARRRKLTTPPPQGDTGPREVSPGVTIRRVPSKGKK